MIKKIKQSGIEAISKRAKEIKEAHKTKESKEANKTKENINNVIKNPLTSEMKTKKTEAINQEKPKNKTKKTKNKTKPKNKN